MDNKFEVAIREFAKAHPEILPDHKGWRFRMFVKSRRSGNKYVVSQNIAHKHWGCSCAGWRIHRKCEHLEAMGLPNYEKPFEIEVKAKTK